MAGVYHFMEGLAIATIDLDRIKSLRSIYDAYKLRKPKLYGKIVEDR